MGWEFRHGTHRYLYRSYRVNGKPVKHYLAPANDRFGVFGFGDLMAYMLLRVQRREAKLRKLKQRVRAEYRGRIDDLLRAAATANGELRVIADGTLYALGFHRHKRSEWRMKLELVRLKGAIAALERQRAEHTPVLSYNAPTDDAEAVELFAKARAGDADAQTRVHALIRERKWQEWIGHIGRQATAQLIKKAAGGDPVWQAGLTMKANTLQEELLGPGVSVLEKMLVRRVVNGWIAVHVLELELTVRPPAEARGRAHLDRALSRAQKRLLEATRELARVRKLAVPAIPVNVADKRLSVVTVPAVTTGR